MQAPTGPEVAVAYNAYNPADQGQDIQERGNAANPGAPARQSGR